MKFMYKKNEKKTLWQLRTTIDKKMTIKILHLITVILCAEYQDKLINVGKTYIVIANVILWLICAHGYNALDSIYNSDEKLLNKIGIVKKKDSREHITFGEMYKVSVRNLIINHLLVLITILNTERGFSTEKTNFAYILRDVVLYYIVHDKIFWIIHRIIHLPLIYKIHKQHHSTFGTIAVSCFYMSVVDAVLELFVPFILPVLIINGSKIATIVWSIIAITNTFTAHSGYGILDHYNHHSKQNVNYSVYLTDILLGTRED